MVGQFVDAHHSALEIVASSVAVAAVHRHGARVFLGELARSCDCARSTKSIGGGVVHGDGCGIDILFDGDGLVLALVVEDDVVAGHEARLLILDAEILRLGIVPCPVHAACPCDGGRVAHVENLDDEFAVLHIEFLLRCHNALEQQVVHRPLDVVDGAYDIFSRGNFRFSLCRVAHHLDDGCQVFGTAFHPFRGGLALNRQGGGIDHVGRLQIPGRRRVEVEDQP